MFLLFALRGRGLRVTGDYRQAGGAPLRKAVLQTARLETTSTKRRNSFIGQDAVRASAVRDDLLLGIKLGEARFKLAQTYERMNNLRAAFPEYIRAADALPEARAAQLKAIEVLLLSGKFEDAVCEIGAGRLAEGDRYQGAMQTPPTNISPGGHVGVVGPFGTDV